MEILDNLTRKLLTLIQKNNLLTSQEIGEEIGLSASTVQRRLKQLRASKVIEKDVSIISPDLIGRRMMAIVMLEMERENPNVLSELKCSLSAREEVMQCYWVTGKTDFVLIMTFLDMPAFERFCEEHFVNNNNVKRFYTSVVVSRVKFGLSVPID